MKLTHIVAIVGLTASTSIFAANSDQAAIDTLQKQITQVQTEMHAALASQQASTQKAIADMQKQVQGQIAHLQTEMQQMQAQLTKEIQQVQAEAVKAGSVAAPAKATPAQPTQ